MRNEILNDNLLAVNNIAVPKALEAFGLMEKKIAVGILTDNKGMIRIHVCGKVNGLVAEWTNANEALILCKPMADAIGNGLRKLGVKEVPIHERMMALI